ncbi:hypothetical protein BC829DRAFT_69224 [Chytridium lagenaria]|nr:hypothetical protein BC829DRAFT_69224 [Chytridium lagenaria]
MSLLFTFQKKKDFRNKMEQVRIIAHMSFSPTARHAVLTKIRTKACSSLLDIPFGQEYDRLFPPLFNHTRFRYVRLIGYKGDLAIVEEVFEHVCRTEHVHNPSSLQYDEVGKMLNAKRLCALILNRPVPVDCKGGCPDDRDGENEMVKYGWSTKLYVG